MSSLWRWGRRAGFAVLLVLVTLIVGGACDARRRLADLKPWHRIHLDEMTASALDDRFTFAQYQAGEERLFAQVRALESTNDPADRTPVNRYHPGSLSHPASAGRDWNRSFETTPPSIRAGALLVHGLTDSPYSMRQVANVLSEHGVYSLSLRMPGHGTAPSGLVTATWADWLAAVRMGVRHVRSRIPEGAPLVLVGYSNGGALALKYTLDALDGRGGALPSKVILLSPMIGVTPAAGLAWWISRLGVVPYFEKANWLDVFPEYNPFKYNSFPANAGAQTAYLTRTIRNDLARLAATGQLKAIPPILTFQSIVDATVSTPAVVNTLYDQLPANGSELVLFDVNHVSGIAVFMQPSDRSLVASLLERAPRRYRRVVVTNTSADTRDVEARHAEPGSLVVERRALGLAWPPEMFSLSHVGLPFAPNDPLYGFESAGGRAGLLPLGRLSPRGERGVLTVGTDTLMRLSSNPFFSFVAEQIGQWLAVDPGSVHRPGPAAPSSKRMADGKQWTTQNLNVTTVPSYCYDDADENCRRYGRLYTWESARQGCQSLGDGWRLPTDDEWQQLAKHYGGLLEESAAAGKATFAALIIGGTSGFDAVLSGGRDDREGIYARLEAHGLYWTATETGADRVWFYNFGKGMRALNRHRGGEKKSAYAVRCIRD